MSDNKKYYYLKLKDDFFDSEEIKVLESMENGYVYSNILLKMYLKSIKREGLLIFNERIPYNPKMIATVTGHNINDVKQALVLFNEMGMMEMLSNGAIYMLDIQNFIGKSTTEADRIRAYRNEIQTKKEQLVSNPNIALNGDSIEVVQMYYKCTPEIELELELEVEKELDIDIDKIILLWNNLELNQLRNISKSTTRYKMLKARAEEYSIEDVEKTIKNISNSSFLKGDNKENWIITFDWLVKPNNFIKVLEGNYIDKVSKNKSKSNWKVDAS